MILAKVRFPYQEQSILAILNSDGLWRVPLVPDLEDELNQMAGKDAYRPAYGSFILWSVRVVEEHLEGMAIEVHKPDEPPLPEGQSERIY